MNGAIIVVEPQVATWGFLCFCLSIAFLGGFIAGRVTKQEEKGK